MKMNLQILAAAAALLSAAAAMPGHAGTTLIQQAPLSGGSAVDAVFSNQGQFGFQNAETLALAAPSRVTGLRWWGSQLDDLSLFVVRQYADLASAPDDFRRLAGSLTRSAAPGLTDNVGQAIFAYELSLDQPFDEVAGELQFSVFVDSDAAAWFWLEASAGDGASALRGADGSSWDWLEPDLALAVMGERLGNRVPAPGGGLLVVAALAALGATAARLGQRRPTARG